MCLCGGTKKMIGFEVQGMGMASEVARLSLGSELVSWTCDMRRATLDTNLYAGLGLFVGAVFLGRFPHRPQVFDVARIDAGAAGQNIAAAWSACLNELAAVFLHLLTCARHYDR